MQNQPQTSKRLQGKAALVTGSSKGIGKAIALRLAADGADVIVNYHHSPDQANEIVRQIQELGSRAVAVAADMGQVADVRKLFAEADTHFGKVDILVNNAASFAWKPFAQLTTEDFDHVFALNAKIPMIAMQEAEKRMPNGGRIINISTWATVPSAPYNALYVASKAALEQLTKSFAKEVGRKGITVNAVLPGYINSDGFAAGATEEFRQMAINLSAVGRLGEPADVADAVAFLASDDARFITGVNIAVTGGL